MFWLIHLRVANPRATRLLRALACSKHSTVRGGKENAGSPEAEHAMVFASVLRLLDYKEISGILACLDGSSLFSILKSTGITYVKTNITVLDHGL